MRGRVTAYAVTCRSWNYGCREPKNKTQSSLFVVLVIEIPYEEENEEGAAGGDKKDEHIEIEFTLEKCCEEEDDGRKRNDINSI